MTGTWKATCASEIAAILECDYEGGDNPVSHPAPLHDATPDALCFLNDGPRAIEAIPDKVGLLITVPNLVAEARSKGLTVLSHSKPKFAICKAAYHLMRQHPAAGIHPTAILGPDVKLGKDVTIGPFSILDGTITLQDNAVIESHVTLNNSVTIGPFSRIRSGARIGFDPFSLGRNNEGETYVFPATGGVQIGAFVNIFENTTIARGAFDDTFIEDWVQIGDLVQIGNTVRIRSGAVVCPQAQVGSQVDLGSGCWVGLGAAVRQRVTVGARAFIGLGAVVVSDVPEAVTVMGVPARAR